MGLIVQKGVLYPDAEYSLHELTDVNDRNKSDGSSIVYNETSKKYESKVLTKTLTWAEYQALSDAEKNNGTIYMISDVNGDGQSFQPVIYSEDEREIGVWIDGKPLYEKTIAFTNSVNYYSLNVSALNIDYLVDAVARIHNNTGGDYTVAPYYEGSNDKFNYYFANDKQSIIFRSGLTYTIGSGYVTIRYTKTTDVAGSGTWTPQGVPAHHYSTDEQIVGTWIDGKPLYEKTIKFNNKNVTAVENTSELVHGISDIDTAFVHEAYADFNGTEKWATAMNNIDIGSNVYSFEWVVGTSAIYLKARNLSFSPSTDRSYLFVIRYTKSS